MMDLTEFMNPTPYTVPQVTDAVTAVVQAPTNLIRLVS